MACSTTLIRSLGTGVFIVAAATAALAQESRRTIGLDPYKPSDAKILREQGPAVATQMTIDEVRKLDPYNPTDASLLRQMGGAIPVCCLDLIGGVPPIGVGLFAPQFTHASRPAAAVRTNPNVVWVCRGAACASADVRTHQFSRTPETRGTLAPDVR